jgi:hypothetical protein
MQCYGPYSHASNVHDVFPLRISREDNFPMLLIVQISHKTSKREQAVMIPYEESIGPMGKHQTGTAQIPHDTTQKMSNDLNLL